MQNFVNKRVYIYIKTSDDKYFKKIPFADFCKYGNKPKYLC